MGLGLRAVRNSEKLVSEPNRGAEHPVGTWRRGELAAGVGDTPERGGPRGGSQTMFP